MKVSIQAQAHTADSTKTVISTTTADGDEAIVPFREYFQKNRTVKKITIEIEVLEE